MPISRAGARLGQTVREIGRVQRTKVEDGAVGGEVVGTEHPKRHVLMQLPGNLARAENASGIDIDQYFDHHGTMKGAMFTLLRVLL